MVRVLLHKCINRFRCSFKTTTVRAKIIPIRIERKLLTKHSVECGRAIENLISYLKHSKSNSVKTVKDESQTKRLFFLMDQLNAISAKICAATD